MDVTFVLEESGVTATVEVPCEADVAAAKEVACTALAVSPASVEMRIGTQVLEGTCRLQDTAFDAGVQVVLARRFANIKCPAEYSLEVPPRTSEMNIYDLSLSPCGALCLFAQEGYVTGLDTETFSPAFKFKVDIPVYGAPAISRCKTRCYLACKEEGLHEVALPGGEVLRKVDGFSNAVYACGGVVVSRGRFNDGVSVYDEDLTLLWGMALSDCRPSSDDARLWDMNTGEVVACVAEAWRPALSRCACAAFALGCDNKMKTFDWSGATLGSFEIPRKHHTASIQITPCGKYLVVKFMQGYYDGFLLHQYDVATTSCVRVFRVRADVPFALSPCSRMVVLIEKEQYLRADGLFTRFTIETRHLYPY